MRIFYFFLAISCYFLSIYTNAQSILVNSTAAPETNLNAEELTNQVLIDGGACSEISNFQLIDNPGAQFPNINRSWGYFERGASDFPFERGIILTSGYARNAVGPSGGTNSDGSWNGDGDLVVLSGGYASNDATIFEFDFVPFGNEISFNYIFASEEYPNWTCGNYNDAFGFIISGPGITNDPGLNGKNIALLPNGLPVTINNVNDDFCGDNTYYVGGPFQDIAFGGRTTPLTAYSEVVPGETYHIRLVISDIYDGLFDSAVFLEAGSFNLGGTIVDLEGVELGESKTLCDVEAFPLTINLEAEQVSYQWYFNDVAIPGATGATYLATETGNYKVQFFANQCEGDKDIDLIFSHSPDLISPEERFECSDTGTFTFNLEDFQPEISPDFENLIFQYYNTFEGAQNQELGDMIMNFQNFVVNEGDGVVEVFVRVKNEDSCFNITSIRLDVGISPDTSPLPLSICDDNGDGIQTFDLVNFAPNLVNSDPTGLTYEFYTNAAGTDLIPNPNAFENTTNPQTIYVKIYNPSLGDKACPVFEELTLVVDEFPALEAVSDDICDNLNDGSEFVDLTQYNVVATQGMNLTYLYFDALGNPIANPTNYELTNLTTTIEVLVRNQAGTCEGSELITLNLLEAPVVVNELVELEQCSLTDFATFNLLEAVGNFVADPTGLIFSFHITQQEARDNVNPLPVNFTNTLPNQILFVRIQNENGCYEIARLSLSTILIHNQLEVPTTVCDDPYEINDGVAYFDLTQRHGDIENSLGAVGYTVLYFESLEDAMNGINVIANPTVYQNISNPQTIYARAETATGGCGGIVDFEIEVSSVPEFEMDANAYFCNTDVQKLYEVYGVFDSYKWMDEEGNIISTQNIVEFPSEGIYTLEVTQAGSDCPARRDIEVLMDNQPTVTNIIVNGHTVTVSATGGYPPYEYSYNNGLTWHDEYILLNVPGGIHDLLVRSKYGCISEARTFGVLGIPNFISPNGDGINDVWEIRGLEVHLDAHLQIFDRYGKIFVDRKVGPGFVWDGKYLGNPIPSGDYWYIITISDGKKVTGHISVRNR
jgi:gliding motility-associated-like protein